MIIVIFIETDIICSTPTTDMRWIMEEQYKVVRTIGRTHLGGGGSPVIVKIGSLADCEVECARLMRVAGEAIGDSLDAILQAATAYVVEPAAAGDKVWWSQ